ncbi:endopeptidase La [Schleiferiaceae bacterium]|jgi:ATP-dependent Lon protease|nr:endopeptidase La [Schleiferiaceae bacterium]MDA8769274.1 endopeptidase La [Schleiferiaceae bacterium]MDB4123996.1 endopeptidase La [Schleiferiaceae bacterium]MDB9837418.1 endopeptidase La [Schleiferiaceae bacterium]MDC3237521.1 endopeptidase La [Schleiferiaceae bacterium]
MNMDTLSLSDIISESTEFIPLMTSDEEVEINDDQIPELLPILPLRNTVIFPGVVAPITAGRDKSLRLIKSIKEDQKFVGMIAQRDGATEDPGQNEVFPTGTLAQIVKSFKMPDGNTTIIIQGKKRFRILEWVETEPFNMAKVEFLPEFVPGEDDAEFTVLMDSIKDIAARLIQESPHIPSEAQAALDNIKSNTFLLNFIASNSSMKLEKKQEVLELDSLKERAVKVLEGLNLELKMLEVKNEIHDKVKHEFDQQQREYFLHQQMKTIQEELGGNSSEGDIEEMRQRSKGKTWDSKTSEHFEKELRKLQRLNPQMPEFAIQRNYLEFMLDLPFESKGDASINLKAAQKSLDADHYGLEKVKERILEHLAVLKLKGDMKSPILCLAGPPGVGKTSLGKSIAEALGRPYVRMSLGGLRDEAEIRGHRKTYIGAMPGRVLQNMKKAGSNDPVFILDEIDKLSYGTGGDPSSSMLEVLDPEQNNSFYDNYLEMGYDLSKVFFIATANNLGAIQPALLDRMEIINVSGYTTDEKVEIAKRHLVPKQLENHGLTKGQFSIGKPELKAVVEGYTRESGVRSLDKKVAKLIRHTAKDIAMGDADVVKIEKEAIGTILGPSRERDSYEGNDHAGVVTGLAWTPVGGDILFIESSISRGIGKVIVTGNLGDVMKESATIALAYLKSNAEELGIDPKLFTSYDINIHVPQGAIPKDGPSAGITLLTALTSLFTQKRVAAKLAMTGEITLRGKVLPVGGIKEKILAAKRAKITTIVLCDKNRKDIEEIEDHYLKGMTFHYVGEMREVLDLAILDQKVKNAKKLVPVETKKS